MRRALLLCWLAAGCAAPSAPERPTWADVEPIVRGHCTHCHGATAAQTARAGDEVYRLDFYEVTEEVCGDAARALDAPPMAHAFAALVGAAVAPPEPGARARMPPPPAPALDDWERDTLVRWAREPVRGLPEGGNALPQLTVPDETAYVVGDRFDATVVAADPDGEPVVGVLSIGDLALRLDGPGSFRVGVDTSAWETGRYAASACLCDGWDHACYALPDIVVVH
jgi:hypothetical protein